jgi:hypothetical protein
MESSAAQTNGPSARDTVAEGGDGDLADRLLERRHLNAGLHV